MSEPPQGKPPAPPVPDVPEHLKAKFAYFKERSKEEAETRSSFTQHLAVLCAGSIAVIASGAVAILSYRASHPSSPLQISTRAVLASGTSLWLSLACCILHNFLETRIQHRSSEEALKDALHGIFEFGAGIYAPKTTGDPWEALDKAMSESKLKLNRSAKRTLALVKCQRLINAGAVLFFLVGYAALVYLTWAEVRLI